MKYNICKKYSINCQDCKYLKYKCNLEFYASGVVVSRTILRENKCVSKITVEKSVMSYLRNGYNYKMY